MLSLTKFSNHNHYDHSPYHYFSEMTGLIGQHCVTWKANFAVVCYSSSHRPPAPPPPTLSASISETMKPLFPLFFSRPLSPRPLHPLPHCLFKYQALRCIISQFHTFVRNRQVRREYLVFLCSTLYDTNLAMVESS